MPRLGATHVKRCRTASQMWITESNVGGPPEGPLEAATAAVLRAVWSCAISSALGSRGSVTVVTARFDPPFVGAAESSSSHRARSTTRHSISSSDRLCTGFGRLGVMPSTLMVNVTSVSPSTASRSVGLAEGGGGGVRAG